MPPPLHFPAHVHAVALGDDIVVLDSAADSYLCLPDGASLIALGRDGRTLTPADDAVADALIAAGLAQGGAPAQPGSGPPPALPTQGLPDAGRLAVGWRDALTLAACVLDVLVHYRGRPFAAILAFAGAGRARARRRVARADVVTLAQRFQVAAVWLPIPRKCLARSFALLRFLQRSGHDARWVFGVRTWPFGAHCWLQVGDVVLDDLPERLVQYRPIHAL
jgi:hypothetical protein